MHQYHYAPVHLCSSVFYTSIFVHKDICTPVEFFTKTFEHQYSCTPVHMFTGSLVLGYICTPVHQYTSTVYIPVQLDTLAPGDVEMEDISGPLEKEPILPRALLVAKKLKMAKEFRDRDARWVTVQYRRVYSRPLHYQ